MKPPSGNSRVESDSRTRAIVTPRFDLFYALRHSHAGAATQAAGPLSLPKARTVEARVAPLPVFWPLIADCLKSAEPRLELHAIAPTVAAMSPADFASAILEGFIKDAHRARNVARGIVSLRELVRSAEHKQRAIFSYLGLEPFRAASPAVRAIERLVAEPAAFQTDVVRVLEAAMPRFSTLWSHVDPVMQTIASDWNTLLASNGFARAASHVNLPSAFSTATGDVYLVPSAFNRERLWACYSGSRTSTYYFPVLVDELAGAVYGGSEARPLEKVEAATAAPPERDAGQILRALGDTTRYSILSWVARTPATSVELARKFRVSKPTISHHVHVLRDAALLTETPTPNGVVLAPNRRTLEALSAAVVGDLYGSGSDSPEVRRSRTR